MESWDHLCVVLEEDMELVRNPDDDDCVLDNLYQTKHFFYNVDGKCELKEYNTTCEYCHNTMCDRMTLREELDHEYEELCDTENMINDDKKITYRNYIYNKYGRLRRDIGMRVPKCVVRYIEQMFPLTEAKELLCNRN